MEGWLLIFRYLQKLHKNADISIIGTAFEGTDLKRVLAIPEKYWTKNHASSDVCSWGMMLC